MLDETNITTLNAKVVYILVKSIGRKVYAVKVGRVHPVFPLSFWVLLLIRFEPF